MEGKIVFEGTTEKGLPIIIRYPKVEDAEAMTDYINEVSAEQTFIAFQGKKFTLEEERAVIQSALDDFKKKNHIKLVVFSGEKMIAIADISMSRKDAMKHEGAFGISVLSEFRGQGVGKMLMQVTIDEALKHIPQLKIISLGVFGNNDIAIQMYKDFGFTEFGRLPEGILHKGQYVDHVYMYKKVR